MKTNLKMILAMLMVVGGASMAGASSQEAENFVTSQIEEIKAQEASLRAEINKGAKGQLSYDICPFFVLSLYNMESDAIHTYVNIGGRNKRTADKVVESISLKVEDCEAIPH